MKIFIYEIKIPYFIKRMVERAEEIFESDPNINKKWIEMFNTTDLNDLDVNNDADDWFWEANPQK